MLEKYRKTLCRYPCNFCGRNDYRKISSETRFNTRIPVVMCRQCGLICLNPRWPKESYANFYKDDYRKLIPIDADPSETFKNQLTHGEAILKFCDGHLADGMKVFEIGCAAGGVLRIFKDRKNADVVGLEPNISHSQFASQNLNSPIATDLIEDYAARKSEYDCIIMTQTVNHLLDPKGVFQKVHSMLKDGGKFYIDVQNFSEYLKLAREPFQVDHIYYFFPDVLLSMLKSCGFAPLKFSADQYKDYKQMLKCDRHKGAFLHIHILAEKVSAIPEYDYPDSQRIFRVTQARIAQKKIKTFCLSPFRLARNLLYFLIRA